MRTLRYVTWQEDGAFVAQCLDVDVASEGDTQEESVANLKEALELYFEDTADLPLLTPPSRVRLGEMQVNA
ncbi:MAG: type II toxin-antitoxin system HicB family antitoxin [Gammaproteobacteria bacterium]|nr:type II toxin-antitoxin system HicB family antitoxin [Gammaproteobacteria bacterium]